MAFHWNRNKLLCIVNFNYKNYNHDTEIIKAVVIVINKMGMIRVEQLIQGIELQ